MENNFFIISSAQNMKKKGKNIQKYRAKTFKKGEKGEKKEKEKPCHLNQTGVTSSGQNKFTQTRIEPVFCWGGNARIPGHN